MKIAYKPKRFGADAKLVIARANDVLEEYASMGYDMTLRQVYYQCSRVANMRKTKIIREVDIAWAAGLFDGEGCITITKQHPGKSGRVNVSHRLYIKLTMTHKATVERFGCIAGAGSLTFQRRHKEHHNDAWTWWLASRQAVAFLSVMRPYLLTKAPEADLAFEFDALPRGLTGGAGGNAVLPPELVTARERLFVAMRDAKSRARLAVA